MTQAGKRVHVAAIFARPRAPSRYRVGRLGAYTFVSRRTLDFDARFERIWSLSFPSEDQHYCIRAAELGLGLFVGTHVPAYPIYRERHLDRVAAFLGCTLFGRAAT